MKPTDFSVHVTSFLTHYLAAQRNLSPNTIKAYRDMIRDFLGHVDAKTTQIYARANLEMKRNALEKINEPSLVQTIPCWQQSKDLLDWLRSL